jgi:hypothetical protein
MIFTYAVASILLFFVSDWLIALSISPALCLSILFVEHLEIVLSEKEEDK